MSGTLSLFSLCTQRLIDDPKFMQQVMKQNDCPIKEDFCLPTLSFIVWRWQPVTQKTEEEKTERSRTVHFLPTNYEVYKSLASTAMNAETFKSLGDEFELYYPAGNVIQSIFIFVTKYKPGFQNHSSTQRSLYITIPSNEIKKEETEALSLIGEITMPNHLRNTASFSIDLTETNRKSKKIWDQTMYPIIEAFSMYYINRLI